MAWQDARILRRKCLESMGPRNAMRKRPFISLEHGEPFLNEHGILASSLTYFVFHSLSSSPDWVTVKTSRSPRAWLLRKSPQSVKFHTKSCGSVWFWPSGGADYIGGSNIRPAGQVRNKYRRNQDLCNSGIWLPIKIFIWICLLGWEYTTASCSAKWPQWGLSLSSGSWSRCKFQRQKWKVPQN